MGSSGPGSAACSGCWTVVRLSGERVVSPLRPPTEGAGSSFLLSCFPPTSFTMFPVNVFHTVGLEAGCSDGRTVMGPMSRMVGSFGFALKSVTLPTVPVPG